MINQNKNNIQTNENEITNDIYYHKYNLFQQFFIIGLEPKINHLLKIIQLKALPEPLIGPKIISKYPNSDLPYLNIPDSLIISHCFPNGFKNSILECEENSINEKLNTKYDFVFSLDNYQMNKATSIRINKVYYTCYLFYEKFENYMNCITFRKKKEQIINFNKIYLIPKIICISSFSPYIQQSKLLLHIIKKYVDNMNYNKLTDNSNTDVNEDRLPLEKIIEGLIYNLPGIPRADFVLKINKNNFVSDNELKIESNFYENENEIIFENSPPNKKMKPIINYSLLMRFFKIEEIFEIIKCILLEEPILFFCNNIEYLTYTIEGILSLIYPFEYHYPVIAVLPEENYSFINVYKSFIFGINYTYTEDILVLKGINIDEQSNINIVIIENRFNSLLNNNEKEKIKASVILNFKPNNSKFLKISQKSINNSISEIKELYIKKTSMLGINKEEDKNEDKNENDKKIKLPSHYYAKCCKKFENNLETKFKELKNKYKDLNSKNAEIEKEKIFNDEIIEIFLYFFTSIFLHYQEFCAKFKYLYDVNPNRFSKKQGNYFLDKELEKKYYTNKLTISDLFNCDLFIDEMPNLDKPFYIKFLKTKIFFNFMKKKIFPLSLQDKLDILFFDDKVNEKLSRESGIKKIETKFLEYDTSNITGEISINILSKPFSDNFNGFLLEEKNRDKALNYFQCIIYQTSDNSDIKNKNSMENYYSTNSNNNIEFKFSFYYFVFPKLLNDGLFYKEYKKEDELNNLWSATSFTSKNSNCLYNQFEKEGNTIIKDENVIKNYNSYYYSFSPIKSYSRTYDLYVKILYLQYFSKLFYQIPYSKKSYYFNYLMYFMTQNKNILDQNSIMMMFNTIIKYGDKNMAQYFFPFIKNKTYTIFLILREKIRPDKNILQNNKSEDKITDDDFYDENYIENSMDIYSKKGRSLSGCNSSSIRLSSMPIKKRKSSSIDGDEKNDDNLNSSSNENISMKDSEKDNNHQFNFNLNLFCTQKNGENICNYPFDLKLDNFFDENKKYMEIKCPKCGAVQQLSFGCKYKDKFNNNYIIKTKLYSPLTLLESEWFENANELNLTDLSKNHLDEYINSLFYFYEQGLLSDFLIPETIAKKELKVESNSLCVTKSQKIENEKKIIINRNEGKNNINSKANAPRTSIFDISDQKQSFFEFKSNTKNKKPSSLISHNIKKKNNPTKKSVGFAAKTKKITGHKKNCLSYSSFLNNN